MAAIPKPRKPSRESFGSKVEAHGYKYRTKDGSLVPGATTITGCLGSPQKLSGMIRWGNRLGLEGIDSSKYTDETAAIGSAAHYMCECFMKGEDPELGDFTANQIERATWAFDAYKEWAAAHNWEPILVEGQLVSESLKVGGKIDWYGKLDGRLTLLDLKTSKSIYEEHEVQVAGYAAMLTEAGYKVQDVLLVRIPREQGEKAEPHPQSRKRLMLNWRLFKAAVEIYYARRERDARR